MFSIAAFFKREQVKCASTQPSTFQRTSASGKDVVFRFCPACGTTLWWEPERMPHLVGVAVGAFADPDFPRPEQAVWRELQHQWLQLPDEMVSHARNPAPTPQSS